MARFAARLWPRRDALNGLLMDLWPSCGYAQLQRDAAGGLVVTDDYLRLFLARPELAPLAESCASERALHNALLQDPRRDITPECLGRLQDVDARENYAVYLRFRQQLLATPSLQAAYVGLFRAGPISLPPLFIDLMAQALVRGLLEGGNDAFEARAGELLFRPQRITLLAGRVLAGDRDTLDLLQDTAGLGDLGRLLKQAQMPLQTQNMAVLAPDNQALYWAAASAGRHSLLLDLSHDIQQPLGHGLQFTLKNASSGLPALARMLERWVAQLLGVQVHIEPVPRIDDADWRWHLGLDAESTALLNDLYLGRPVDEARRARLISLFRLHFDDAAEMHPLMRKEGAALPVYLGLAHGADGVLRLKPQNLLLSLPLALAS